MNAVFLDTVGLIALWDRSDQWHAVASVTYQVLLQSHIKCATTTAVLLECGNSAARKPYRIDVEDLRVRLERANLLILPIEADWQSAWSAFRGGTSASPGIVDEISFAVMRRYGIVNAFTNDRHFRAAGFNVLF